MRRQPGSWRAKVHPAFLEIAAMSRSLAHAQKANRVEEVRDILTSSVRKREELLEPQFSISPGTPCYQLEDIGYLPASVKEKTERLLDWYFFKRFRSPRWVALHKEKGGDLEAHSQLARATDEFWRLLHGHGPVPPFKADQVHSDLLELGLHLGLQELSADELADCFDGICPCGKVHSGDAIKKQRARTKEEIVEALRLKAEYKLQRPAWERFAVYGKDGFIARPYCQRDGNCYVEITRKERGLEYVVYGDGSISGFQEESHLSRLQILGRLPATFGVHTTDDIFRMFFPKT